MTVSTASSSIIALGNGATTNFTFPFIGVAASDISVIYTNASGVATLLPTSSYTIALNSPTAGQLWGVGGNVSYTPAIATGTSLTIARNLPLTQAISILNQGNFDPQVIEQALDILCMQNQQLAARTTQFRGIWLTGTIYNIGDIVQDGVNGGNTANYYICQIANTSGTWATDLASGDWAVSVLAVVPSITPGTVSATGSPASGNLAKFSGSSSITNGDLSGDITTSGTMATTLATVNSNVGAFTNSTITVNAKGLVTAASTGTSASKLTTYQVTDSADTALGQINSSDSNIGSTKSITVPTKGYIVIGLTGEVINSTATNQIVIGLKIGSTIYYPVTSIHGSDAQQEIYIGSTGAGTDIVKSFGVTNTNAVSTITGGSLVCIPIEESGIPTGVQTVQVVGARVQNVPTCTLKGTVITTRVYIETHDYS